MKLRSLSAVALVAALCATGASQSQASRTVQVRAAIGLLDSDQVAGARLNSAPYAWYNLEQNRKIKPAAWELTNPLHETQFSTETVNRFVAQGLGTPAVGTLVQKYNAPYWEMRVSAAGETQLSNLDVMLISASGTISLNAIEREKLRRFVDRGGVLWIDILNSANLDVINGFPFGFGLDAPGGPVATDYTHPLTTYPYGLSATELATLTGARRFRTTDLTSLGALAPLWSPLPFEGDQMQYVHGDNRPAIAVMRLGDGFIVLTSGVGQLLNQIPTGSGAQLNRNAVAIKPAYDRLSDAAARFAVNVVSLTSGGAQPMGGSRRNTATPIDIGAPQLTRFVDDTASQALSSPRAYKPPVVFKGIVFVTTDTQVLAYDSNPKQDLDGDGDPDDGFRDYGVGDSKDLIWASENLNGPISSPVAYEVPAETGDAQMQVAVTDAAGNLVSFSAMPFDANGRLLGPATVARLYTVAPAGGVGQPDFGLPDAGPYAPVFHEGLLFMVDGQDSGLGRFGRVWVADPLARVQMDTGGNRWSVGGSSAPNVIADPSGQATVGYIPVADNSGALDRVIYVPGRGNPLGGGPNANASITSIWFGSKGEKPTRWQISGGFLEITTRAASQALDVYIGPNAKLNPRLSLIRPNGDPYAPADMPPLFTGLITQSTGTVRIQMNGAATLPADTGVRLDYTIDWGFATAAESQRTVRSNLYLPDNDQHARRIAQGIALSPNGTMHLVLTSQDRTSNSGGTYMAIREEGRGNFKVLNRFDLYNRHQIMLNQTSPVTYPATLGNTDPVLGLIPFAPIAGEIQDQTFAGMPSVRDGVAYVTATGRRRLGFFDIPYTFVMAFRAEPEGLRVRLNNVVSDFTILQPDVTRSQFAPNGTPDVFSVQTSNQLVFEEDGAGGGILRFDSLANTGRGAITDCFSTSQPLIIRANGEPDVIIEPNATNGNWNQMLWYTVLMGTDTTAPAYVTGRTLFWAGASASRDFLNGNFPPSNSALIGGINLDISPNSVWLGAGDPGRPWFRQLYSVRGANWNVAESNPAIVMPSSKGVTSFGDYLIRLEQTILSTTAGTRSQNAFGVVGGDNALFAWGAEGIWGFGRANFVVADSNRIARLDSDGSPAFTLSSTFATGRDGDLGGVTGNVKPFSLVSRAYPLGERQMLIVDTGASRVIRAESSGRELRVIEGFTVGGYRPAGMTESMSLKLDNPRDAKYFTSVVQAANNPFPGAAPYEQWQHYLIADTGNRRLVEIVDRNVYDPTTRRVGAQQGFGQLNWISPSTSTGGRFAYVSLDRVFVDGVNPRWVYVAGVGNTNATRSDLGLDSPGAGTRRAEGTTNGAIVIFDGLNSIVVDQINLPAIGANVLYNDATATWANPAEPVRVKKLSGLNSISVRNLPPSGGNGRLAIMITDETGVYEVVGDLVPNATFDALWMMTRSVYRNMRRDPANNIIFTDNPEEFRPTFAKRLESGDVLITNGYSGWYRRNLPADARVAYTGEVALIEGSLDGSGTAELGFNPNKLNWGFKSISIRALLNNKPGVTLDTRGIVSPVFADRL